MALAIGIKEEQVIAVGPTRLLVVRASQTTSLLRWFYGAKLAEEMLVTVDAHDWRWLSPVPVDGVDHIVRVRLAPSRKPRLVLDALEAVAIERDPPDAPDFR